MVASWLYAPWVVSYDGETRRGDFQEQTWQFADVCEPPLQRPLRVNHHALAPLNDDLVDEGDGIYLWYRVFIIQVFVFIFQVLVFIFQMFVFILKVMVFILGTDG